MPASQFSNIQPKRILVITMRYLGDTLLVTPLIGALRQAYPEAEIDVLLPAANCGMLMGNRHVNRLIPLVSKDILSFAGLLFSLFRQYDLAISTQAGDRPLLSALIAGKYSMGFIAANTAKYSWKRLLLDSALAFNVQQNHAVLENLRFCQPLNIAPSYVLMPPRQADEQSIELPEGKYAVLHIMPQWRYKQWHDAGWLAVTEYLQSRGIRVVLTGSNQAQEQAMLTALQQQLPANVLNLAGSLSLAQLTGLIEKATVFIGPDTGITHLAAATGIPVVAIFGPTDPKVWAPWPVGYADDKSPFVSQGSQHSANIYIVQGQSEQGCVPCQLEGCQRSRQSQSDCLDNLSAANVLDVLNIILSQTPGF
ncbi:glycosyltransferase family 9 protein [Methylomonas paludis]|uniref:Glycosyltransferase family 9 protein n=2 Tax=Methylomonas paludis TaxID=1173101 RepID=A0A975MMJ1_9GAMM|nr:glycosyltransferase family 9 protein [Methylomonas paludis]